jgi:tyrosine-protein kinase Etk/Wzc
MTPKEQSRLDLPAAYEEALPRMFEGQQKSHLIEPLIVLAKHKLLIFYSVAGATLCSIVVCLLLPTYYTATTKILPPQQGQSFASAMLDQLGGLGSVLGASAGGGLLRNPSDLYVDMLRSETVADRLIDHFSLMTTYKSKLREDARRRLADLTGIKAAKDGIITVSVDDRDPRRAADIANRYIEELDALTKTLAVTDAGKRRVFFEREAKTATDQLEVAEQDFKKIQESTGIIQIDSQSKVMLQAYEDLRAQLTAKQLEIESMRSFATPQNPDLLRLEHERDALRAQVAGLEKGQGGSPVGDIALEKIPEKALKYIDKLREVTYRSSLLQLMLKQYEIARIDEAKEAALIQVLDKGLPPEKKSWPKRSLIVLLVACAAFLLACIWAHVSEAMERAKADPQYLERLQLLKFYFSSSRKT